MNNDDDDDNYYHQELIAPLRFNFAYETLSDHNSSLMNSITSDPNNTNGWSSIRFCSYPQMIIIKFMEVVSLKQIKILFHQYKIPQQVDVFIYNPSLYQHYYIDPLFIPFERIGYITPNSNESNDFKVREHKSIMMNISCLYLKLQLHECYRNRLNTFHQVGIIRLECFGRGLGNEEGKNVQLHQNDKVKASCYMELLLRDDDYDELTKVKIRQLKNRIYIEKDEYILGKMNKAHDELRILGRKMINLRQLERNYELVKDQVKQKEIWKEMNILHKTIENYNLPDNYKEKEKEQEKEIPIEEVSKLYHDIITENHMLKIKEEDDDEDNNNNIIEVDNKQDQSFQSSHHSKSQDDELFYNQHQNKNNEKTNAILQKFRHKKDLIQQSHYEAKDALTRENILYHPKINL